MPNTDINTGGGIDTMTGTGPTGTSNRVSDAANQAKERAAEVGRNAVESLDRGIDTAASKLQNTASSLRQYGQGEGRVSSVANRAADTIEKTAGYMREHDVRDMLGDVEGAVRRNPGPSLIIAAAFGFLLGTAMRGGNRNRY